MIKNNKQFGFSLIEMMIGITVGLFIISGAIGFYIVSAKSSSDTIKSARLNQDLNAVMQLVVNDIRRAGYGTVWGNIPLTIDTTEGAECILYAYLNDTVGGTNLVSSRGFKLNNGVMEMKIFEDATPAAPISADLTCDSASEPLTDNSVITITDFEITDISRYTGSSDGTQANVTPGDTVVKTLTLDITLSGELVRDSTVAKTLTQSVRVVNNISYTAAP